MSDIILPYTTPQDREVQQAECPARLKMTPLNCMSIVYELLEQWMIANTPAEEGYKINHVYSSDKTKSGIFMDIAYNWKTSTVEKYPAIFIQRGDVKLDSPTMNQATRYEVEESSVERLIINRFAINVVCIATNVGFAEEFADYVKQPLLIYRSEIKNAFNFRHFSLVSISRPELKPEQKDNFAVNLTLDVAYDEGWVIKSDDLKIKTIGRAIFDGVQSRPLTNQ